MTAAQHRQAIQVALEVNDQIGETVARFIGTAHHPRGRLLAAYRNARRALAGNLRPADAREILNGLRSEATGAVQEALASGVTGGLAAGRRSLEIYRVSEVSAATPGLERAGLTAVTAVLDGQILAIQAMIDAGIADEALILGDENRVGLLSPAPVQRESARWIALATVGALALVASRGTASSGRTYFKQAVAAIDERTTNCCLLVNGQVQPQNKPFVLNGTPRFADKIDHPPFHHHCRTAEALVEDADADDEYTREMRDAARAELTAREERGREEIHPAFSSSRRG
jgi:hypothetical protein